MKISKIFLWESFHHYQKCPFNGQLSLVGYALSSVPGELNSINPRTLFLEQKICDLDLEFICKYGPLGYGYSHQLHGLSEKTPAQEVEDSVFFRLPGIDVSQIHFINFQPFL